MHQVKGLGDTKISKYGQELLKIIQSKTETDLSHETNQNHQSDSDSIQRFIKSMHPRPLKGPWKTGFALDFHSRFSGSQWQRTEIGEWVYQLKYKKKFSFVYNLINKLIEFIEQNPEYKLIEAVLSVPPSQERAKDPMCMIARGLAEKMKWPVLQDVLIKRKTTKPQKEMTNFVLKKRNVEGVFKVAHPVMNKRLLLLDDFCDSGATLEEAAKTLKRAGAREVFVLTLTKTIHAEK